AIAPAKNAKRFESRRANQIAQTAQANAPRSGVVVNAMWSVQLDAPKKTQASAAPRTPISSSAIAYNPINPALRKNAAQSMMPSARLRASPVPRYRATG